MDSLALLCNLYGDGPQTLRRLREAGCGTLAALESIESERLASLLRTSVRAARRFQSEGRLLRERSEPPMERSSRRKSGDEPASPTTAASNPLLAPVLVAWREHDARTGPAARALDDESTAARSTQPRGVARVAVLPLEGLEGMDADLIARLRAAGVESLRDLCDGDVLDLAGRGVAGYTRLLRAQFLARRRLGADSERRTAAQGDAVRAEAIVQPAAEAASAAPVGESGRTEAGSSSAADVERCVESGAVLPIAVSTTFLEPDVVIPRPPPERRRADHSQTAPPLDVIARFSPSADSRTPAEPALQSELERYALEHRSPPECSPSVGVREEEGSSGPFA